MLTLLSLLFWTSVVIGLLALYAFLAGRFLQLDRQPDAVHFVVTSDGWRLGLARYRPARPLSAAPVLLCPGLALNGALFDLTPERSLARFLAAQGYDVWVLDWRGRGFSERPRFWGRRRYRWSFDDYLAFDLPAALERLQAETGQTRVLGVGFGLGGLALLVGSGGPGGAALAAVAGLGTVAFFRRTSNQLPGWAMRLLGRLRLEVLTRFFAPLLGRVFPGPLRGLQNRDAIDGPLYRRALLNAVSSPSRREIAQLEEWLQRDQLFGIDQDRDFRTALAQVRVPVLLLAGIRDQLASPEAVEQTASALPGAERQLIRASRMLGMASNYGHLDLLLGPNAQRDIFPHLLRWLDLQSGAELPEGRPVPPSGDQSWPAPLPGAPTAAGAPIAPGAAGEAAQAVTSASAPLFGEAEEPPDPDERDDLDWLDGEVPRVPPRS